MTVPAVDAHSAIEPSRPASAAPDEWLLTSGIGSYAMGAWDRAATRRYHGLLIASLQPPVRRIIALHSLADHITVNTQTRSLTRYAFGGNQELHPDDAVLPDRIDVSPPDQITWTFALDNVCLARTLRLHRYDNAVTVGYRLDADVEAMLSLRPVTPMRDFHSLQHTGHAPASLELQSPQCLHVISSDGTLQLECTHGEWTIDPQWWYAFAYELDRRRGQDWQEDLFAPAHLQATLHAATSRTFELTARIVSPTMRVQVPDRADVDGTERQPESTHVALRRAAEQFVVRRPHKDEWFTTILAGYPWFADWGRDTMIALPGLLLTTGRLDEARQTLLTFARHVRRGIVPNRFDDYGDHAHYNSVDASLWFIHAVWRLWRETNRIDDELHDACGQIIEGFRTGTDFDIAMDADGLIRAGNPLTQLTWMDAKQGDLAFTPRHGKAVEINALWYHGLRAYDDMQQARSLEPQYTILARRIAQAFPAAFWWPQRNCLHDVLTPTDGGNFTPDGRLRPNMLFAVSLAHSPLDKSQQRAVVDAAREHLLTPMGMRTLSPDHPEYRRRYEGDMFNRDSAYHQGTAWPWLIGPYCEAYLRAYDFTAEAQDHVRSAITPLIESMHRGCIGQIAEVFDGSEPQRPGGCPAQAWSVAEVLRIHAWLEQLDDQSSSR
jgi:predicted glycogen debranching enzyme